ncbi:MAG: sulfur oxidation c-type cytochrome SoxA [Pseudomonadota bacterium]
MKPWLCLLSIVLLNACGSAKTAPETNTHPPEPLLSGSEFLTTETRALQADDFANPGYLWVDQGKALFEAAEGSSPSCAACHTDENGSLEGAAAKYPRWDSEDRRMMNLEGQINACRSSQQQLSPLEYESNELLSLTAYVANLSKAHPITVERDPGAEYAFDQGFEYFTTRRGQFNLSCANCHQDNWGQSLRGDTISQGHGNGFPAYRLEWQTLGSLHRRFQDCDTGVRAAPKELGSDTYLALEYYLAVRAAGLEVEAPGVRR